MLKKHHPPPKKKPPPQKNPNTNTQTVFTPKTKNPPPQITKKLPYQNKIKNQIPRKINTKTQLIKKNA
ncbi:hypothetical protein ACNIQY_25330, partial [Escherichia coli]